MKHKHKHTHWLIALLVVATLLPVGAAAQTNQTAEDVAPYYNDSQEVDTNRWLRGISTDLGGMLQLVGRFGTYVIGGGGTGGINGALMTGVVVMGMGVGVVARAPVGGIAGGVLAVGGVFAGAAVGIAPTWMPAVVMLGVGIVIATVAKRVVN